MLCLVGVLLCCGALCLAKPVSPTPRPGCTASSLIWETLGDVQTLKPKGGSKVTLGDKVEEGANINTYLDGFIEALRSSQPGLKEAEIALKLEKIRKEIMPCFSGMEQEWGEEEEEVKEDFSNLEHLLRFLNHNAPWDK